MVWREGKSRLCMGIESKKVSEGAGGTAADGRGVWIWNKENRVGDKHLKRKDFGGGCFRWVLVY